MYKDASTQKPGIGRGARRKRVHQIRQEQKEALQKTIARAVRFNPTAPSEVFWRPWLDSVDKSTQTQSDSDLVQPCPLPRPTHIEYPLGLEAIADLFISGKDEQRRGQKCLPGPPATEPTESGQNRSPGKGGRNKSNR